MNGNIFFAINFHRKRSTSFYFSLLCYISFLYQKYKLPFFTRQPFHSFFPYRQVNLFQFLSISTYNLLQFRIQSIDDIPLSFLYQQITFFHFFFFTNQQTSLHRFLFTASEIPALIWSSSYFLRIKRHVDMSYFSK